MSRIYQVHVNFLLMFNELCRESQKEADISHDATDQ